MFKRIVRILTLCVCSVFIICVANTLADPIIFYDDFHTMDWTPVNPEDCPDFAVDIESPGYIYMIDHYPACGQVNMHYEIPLCRPIGIMEDITVSFKIQALDDVYNGMSSVILSGRNDNDELVFYLQWGDAQENTGRGFLKYFVEDVGTIYFDGYGSYNYPTINDVMELRRAGNRWTAWLGDTQLGSTLIHTPTLECTKLWISFWNVSSPWTTRNDAKIDYIAVHTASGGDANGDGMTNVGDAVHLVNWIFKGGPPPVEPEDAGCPER